MQLKYHMVTIADLVPDHSTVSHLRRRKPGFRKVFRRLFEEVVRQCVEKGLVSRKLMATDSTFVRPQSTHDRTNVELKRDSFSYNAEQNSYICPVRKQLRLNTLHRSASGLYWLCQADKRDCQNCPLREKCLSKHDRRGARKLEHRYFAPQRQRHLAHRYDADYRDALKKRQIWCVGDTI